MSGPTPAWAPKRRAHTKGFLMQSKIVNFALIGLLVGVLVGEFFPRSMSQSFGRELGTALSEPFDNYRNKLATHYGLAGAAIGALIGLIASRGKGN